MYKKDELLGNVTNIRRDFCQWVTSCDVCPAYQRGFHNDYGTCCMLTVIMNRLSE